MFSEEQLGQTLRQGDDIGINRCLPLIGLTKGQLRGGDLRRQRVECLSQVRRPAPVLDVWMVTREFFAALRPGVLKLSAHLDLDPVAFTFTMTCTAR